MRTDVKIGITVGLVLTVIAVVYFVVAEWDQPQSTPPSTETNTTPPGRVRYEPPESTEPEPAREETAEPPARETAEASPPIIIPGPEETATESAPPAAEGSPFLAEAEPPSGMEAEAPGREEPREAAVLPPAHEPYTAPPALRPDTIETIEPRTRPVADYYSNVQRIYVVQPGDNGFWTVSQRMYGHGKYFNVIAEANPRADSGSLRPGQRLVVPPLPQKYRRRATDQTAPRADLLRGERIYVVQKGDEGFWGVSVKVYGHGRYYKTIARANPGVDPENLKAGQRLLIPPKPRDTTTDTAGLTTADLPPGYRIYVVQHGDAGFWDVAVKMYGNGRHFGLIAQANRGVDSRRLQPGQKLRVPPLGEARRWMPATSPVIEERPAEVLPVEGEPRPIFD